MKKRSAQRDAITAPGSLALAVVTRNQKFSPPPLSPSRRHRTAKIKSAGDGHYLYLQTQFVENRCTQFRVIVVTVTARPPARPLQTQTHRQDR